MNVETLADADRPAGALSGLLIHINRKPGCDDPPGWRGSISSSSDTLKRELGEFLQLAGVKEIALRATPYNFLILPDANMTNHASRAVSNINVKVQEGSLKNSARSSPRASLPSSNDHCGR